MPTLSLTISGQQYSATVTDTAFARLDANRDQEMKSLPPGEGQTSETPASERPGYCADVESHVKMMMLRSGLPLQEALDRIVANVADTPALTPQEAAPLTGEALKAYLRAYAADKRYAVETGGTRLPNGLAVATDRVTQNALDRTINALERGFASEPVQWKGATGWIPLTKTDLLGLAAAMTAHVQEAYAAEKTVSDGIEAGTITTTAQIEAAGWPSNA